MDACAVFAQTVWVAVDTGAMPTNVAIAGWSTTSGVREAVARAGDSAVPEMSGWVIHTLTGALWAVLGATSFEDAVWRAVSLGRDADTVGAVAGALAGGLWGLAAIPPSLAGRLQSRHPMFLGDYPDALISLADDLVGLRAKSTGAAAPS